MPNHISRMGYHFPSELKEPYIITLVNDIHDAYPDRGNGANTTSCPKGIMERLQTVKER